MRVDALAVRLRQGGAAESADLGVRLCQQARVSVYRCFALALLPVVALALASAALTPWLAPLVLWWAKPWMDRSILFALARAAFGQRSGWRELWAARREVWWRQGWRSWTLWRLSASRCLTLPVYQLEGLSGAPARARLRQLRAGRLGSARWLTVTFGAAESVVVLGVVVLIGFWMAPQGEALRALLDLTDLAPTPLMLLVGFLPYLCAVLLVEPCYIAAGFGLYLGRRVDLEAWDIEQELRGAFHA